MMSNIELKPCPFCGGEARFADVTGHWLICKECLCETQYYNNPADAVKAWNTRKPIQDLMEQIDEEVEDLPNLERDLLPLPQASYYKGIKKGLQFAKVAIMERDILNDPRD